MGKLAPRRVTACYTPEQMQDIESDILKLKAKLMTPPVMTDKEFDALPKMAEIKRKEVGEKADVLAICDALLSGDTAPAHVDLALKVFDQATTISKWLKNLDDKNWRYGDVAGFQAMNQVSYSEKLVRVNAEGTDNVAIEAGNELDRLKAVRNAGKSKPDAPEKDEAKK